jgi:hypothetical protein
MTVALGRTCVCTSSSIVLGRVCQNPLWVHPDRGKLRLRQTQW